jgi:hypothetical protein
MLRIAAIHVNFCLLLLSNGISVTRCNTMRVYHDTIITWASADSFCSLFSYPLHNPRSHTCHYVTHMTVNGSGVTSRKVQYGSRNFKVTQKKPAVRHIHVKTTILSLWLSWYFVGTSIFVGTSVPSRNTSSSEDISRARCTKRNKGQRWIWNRTSGTKWQQILPQCPK